MGDNIRNYREQRGFYPRKKLAELSNISEKHLSKKLKEEKNQYKKIDTLVNIADALGTSVDKLLLDASSYVEPDYISQITYHLSKLSREDQERLLWHLEQNNVFEIKKKALLKL
ncbi:MAG: helix-turn-helix domain-containing protein [Clostridiales bacterium]|nr:MAG: helix-turn-helix domain-containing protein [Clostridiales bacterium]